MSREDLGKPRKYRTPADLKAAMDGYFEECKAEKRYPTFLGLASHLEFTPKGLRKYRTYGEDFDQVVAMAKQKIETVVVEKMLEGKTPAAAGIFILTRNFGWDVGCDDHEWTNPQRTEHSGPGGGPIPISTIPADVQNALDAHREEVMRGGSST